MAPLQDATGPDVSGPKDCAACDDLRSKHLIGRSAQTTPPNPTLHFEDPANGTTCSTMTFLWNPSFEHTTPMTLSLVGWSGSVVASADAIDSPPKAPAIVTQAAPLRILATNIPSNARTFVWPSVDAPEGWYRANISETVPIMGLSALSQPFFIAGTQNETCRVKTGWADASDKLALPIHRHRISLRPGEVIAVVLGAVIGGICILSVAFLFPHLWRRSLPKHRPYLFY